MKKVLWALIAGLIVLQVFFISGCQNQNQGSINMQTFDYTNFSDVKISGPFEVNITPSDTYSVAVTAPQDWFDNITVKKTGEALEVNLDHGWSFWNWWNKTTPKVSVSMPGVRVVELTGACKGNITGFHSSGDFKINLSGASTASLDVDANFGSVILSGASKVDGQLNVKDAVINLSGASSANLNGSANNINLQASGASKVTLDGFNNKDARIELTGASRASATLSGKLDVFLSGASSLNYSGTPTMGQMDVSGASTLKKN